MLQGASCLASSFHSIAFSLQSLAFISTLFSCLGNDAQRWVLLAGHQCDDYQRTQQKRNVALLVRCKPDTNMASHNAAQPPWSRRNLAILPVVGLLELWKGLGTKDVCRAATDPSQSPTTSLLLSPEWCILFFILWHYWVSSSYPCLLLLLSIQAWKLELKMLLCISYEQDRLKFPLMLRMLAITRNPFVSQ